MSRAARVLCSLAAGLLLSGCPQPVAPPPQPALTPLGSAPPAGEARVSVAEDGSVVMQLNGPTVREAVSELAVAADVAVKVDEEVGTAHHLYLSFRAASAEEALRKLSKLGELSLERETFAGASIYRIGPPRQIFALDLWHLLSAAALLLLALLADRVLDAFLRRQERLSRRSLTRLKQAAPSVRVTLWLFAGTSAVLMLLSVPPSTALALTGGGLLVLGFASRDFASNILSSLAIAIDRPLHLGDFVQVGEHAGEVTRIGLRSTQLLTLDDTTVTLPNQAIATQAVASANYGAIDALIPVSFYVAHDADVARVRSIVWEGVVTSAYCSWRQPVHIVVREETWATRVIAHAYVFDVRHQLLFVTDVTHRVKAAFRKAGVRYPTTPPLPVHSSS